ncbi:hypothetical protein D1007_14449 [Hordeum vulgare]|nr:hypothetical protein D1007_14449 [Hordeum vulgare]
MRTDTATAVSALTMFDEMTEQDPETYVASMINDNEDPTDMDYDLEETTTFVLGGNIRSQSEQEEEGQDG